MIWQIDRFYINIDVIDIIDIDIDSIDKLWISISWPCRWECDNAIDNKVYNHQIHYHAQCTAGMAVVRPWAHRKQWTCIDNNIMFYAQIENFIKLGLPG